MDEQKYALYETGNELPIGTLRTSSLSAINAFEENTEKKYVAIPVTEEEADEITKRITGGPLLK
jgi:hypothetical protein